MRELNRSKPFAEVWGGSSPHRYEQDGIKFMANGMELQDAADSAQGAAEPGTTGKKEPAEPALPVEPEDKKSSGEKK